MRIVRLSVAHRRQMALTKSCLGRTLADYNIPNVSNLPRKLQITLTQFFRDATLHLVPRLRGGGGGHCLPQEMAIAAGGKIKQTVVPDPYSKDIWNRHATVTFNVQILNALCFYSVTGIPAPETPVSAKTYQELGLPFFKMYEEPSNVSVMFSGVNTVGQMVDTVLESSCSFPLRSVDGTLLKKVGGKDDSESDIANPAGPFGPLFTLAE